MQPNNFLLDGPVLAYVWHFHHKCFTVGHSVIWFLVLNMFAYESILLIFKLSNYDFLVTTVRSLA